MIKRVLPIILLIVGMIMLFYPKLTEMYEQGQQQKLTLEWQDSLARISVVDDLMPTDVTEQVEDVVAEVELPEQRPLQSGEIEAMLIIPQINLELPVLHGATNNNLKTSLASIEHTGRPGEMGNYAIAGHRNRTFGRNFNRLDELSVGDSIEVNTGSDIFQYEVTDKQIVKPEEVWVLESDGENKEITLVTCHPMVNPTHRLIIKGRILS